MVINLKQPTTTYLEKDENLSRYYNDIRKFKALTQEEERTLLECVHSDKSSVEEKNMARKALFEANQRFVVAAAKRFATNETILDLINEGNIGLSEAIEKFDVTKKVKFITFAVHYIRRAINFYLIDYGKIVKRSNLNKTYHVISQATNEFVQKEQRDPSSNELLEILNDKYGVGIKDSIDVLDVTPLSIDYSSDEKNDYDPNIVTFEDTTSSSNLFLIEEENEFNSHLVDSLMKKLTPKEGEIIKMLFGIGYDRAYETQEVAEKVGYTTERIRQLKSSILEKLKRSYHSVIETM